MTVRKPGIAKRTDTVELVSARLNIKRILVPTDFSDASRKALRYAQKFAEQFGASLTLLYVLEPFRYDGLAVPSVDVKPVLKNVTNKLATLAQEEIEELVPVNPLVQTGNPYQEIVTAARERNIDLIIISTHGYTGLKHLWLGSTAERVVRHAPCPVLVVREREHEFV